MSEEQQPQKRRLTEQEVIALRKKRDLAYKRKLQQLRDTENVEERQAIYDQLQQGKRAVQKPTTVKGKWENYRYHYGGLTIVCIVAVAIVGWLVYDLVTAEKYDLKILAAVENESYGLTYDSLQDTLTPYFADYDEDGDVDVYVENIQLNRHNTETADSNVVMAMTTKLTASMSDYDYMLFLVDDAYYDMLTDEGATFVDLSAYSDAEGVEGDRYNVENSPAFADLPHKDDLYLVLRDVSFLSEKNMAKYQDSYDHALDLVLSVIEE